MRFPHAIFLTMCVASVPAAGAVGSARSTNATGAASANTATATAAAAAAAVNAHRASMQEIPAVRFSNGLISTPPTPTATRPSPRVAMAPISRDRIPTKQNPPARVPQLRLTGIRTPVAAARVSMARTASTSVTVTGTPAPAVVTPIIANFAPVLPLLDSPAGARIAWRAVDAAELDAARGGFQLPSGLAVGLGIERTVAINGQLITQTRFAVADVRTMNAEQAAMARDAMFSLQLVQNGRVTSNDPVAAAMAGAALPRGLGATIVQNSLDNQRIQSQTVIDASVNSLDGYKALNFSSSVLDALAHATTGR